MGMGAGGPWSNQAQDLVIVGGSATSGVFVYDPTIGVGNLIASMTDATSDPFGNPTLTGVANYFGTLAVQLISGQVNFATLSGGVWTVQNQIALVAGTVHSVTNALSTSGPAEIPAIYTSQMVVDTPYIKAQNPSSLEWSAETWHAMSLLNSWANRAGNVTAQYRLVASPPNSVEVIGCILATAATASTFFTLPAAYRPASVQQFAAGATSGLAAGTGSFITCDTSGNLSTNNITLGAANTVPFHGFISLDA